MSFISLKTIGPIAMAACLFAAASAQAQTVPHTPSLALQAARAAQAAAAAPAAKTSASVPGETVEPVTVRPLSPREGRVVASTNARSLSSPNFGPEDATSAPLAFSLSDNSAFGAVQVDNPTPAGGFLHTNPDLARNPTSTDAGVVSVF